MPDADILMSAEAVAFFKDVLSKPNCSVNIITKNRADYIRELFKYHGFTTEEINKLVFDTTGRKGVVVTNILNSAENLAQKPDTIYVLDDDYDDYTAMVNAVSSKGYSPNQIKNYREAPGGFKWGQYLEEIRVLSSDAPREEQARLAEAGERQCRLEQAQRAEEARRLEAASSLAEAQQQSPASKKRDDNAEFEAALLAFKDRVTNSKAYKSAGQVIIKLAEEMAGEALTAKPGATSISQIAAQLRLDSQTLDPTNDPYQRIELAMASVRNAKLMKGAKTDRKATSWVKIATVCLGIALILASVAFAAATYGFGVPISIAGIASGTSMIIGAATLGAGILLGGAMTAQGIHSAGGLSAFFKGQKPAEQRYEDTLREAYSIASVSL